MGITGPDRLVRCLSRRGRHVGGPRHLCSSSLCLTGWVTPSAGLRLPARWALGRGTTAAPPVAEARWLASQPSCPCSVVGRGRFSYCWQARRHETRIHCCRANTAIALAVPRPCARRDRLQRKTCASEHVELYAHPIFTGSRRASWSCLLGGFASICALCRASSCARASRLSITSFSSAESQ
jgi:hypothetical protein